MKQQEKTPKHITEVDKNIELRSKKKSSKILVKIVAVNMVNLLLILLIFFLLGKLPGLGKELKEVRSARIVAQGETDAAILRSEVERNQEKVEALRALYVDEFEFGNFVTAINRMKDEGAISEITFSGVSAVTNNQNQAGVPIILAFPGSVEQINSSLERLYSLPVLFEVQNAEYEEVAASGETPAGTVLRLNIFLLVDEEFPKN